MLFPAEWARGLRQPGRRGAKFRRVRSSKCLAFSENYRGSHTGSLDSRSLRVRLWKPRGRARQDPAPEAQTERPGDQAGTWSRPVVEEGVGARPSEAGRRVAKRPVRTPLPEAPAPGGRSESRGSQRSAGHHAGHHLGINFKSTVSSAGKSLHVASPAAAAVLPLLPGSRVGAGPRPLLRPLPGSGSPSSEPGWRTPKAVL